MTVPLEEMRRLVGYRFPGGSYTIEHWENFLVHDATRGGPPTADLAHPIYAFNAPLAAMGMSFQDFFDLCRAESNEAIRAGGYDFEYHKPLREGVTYQVTGSILGVDRKRGRRAGLFDLVRFRLDMVDEDGDVAVTATNEWIFLRSDP